MEIQERINGLESRRLELDTRISRSDRVALDYIKGLPGFAEAYPEFAAEFAAVKGESETVDSAITEAKSEWELRIGEPVEAGDIIIHKGVRYWALQPHTLQEDWVPGEVPALYKRIGDEGDEWPEWVQPTGAHDAYNKGDKVSHDGKHWVSDVDANVWAPGVYGWTETH